MVQAITDNCIQKTVGIGSCINKTPSQNNEDFNSILNEKTSADETSKEEKKTDKASELIKELKKMASTTTICGNCGAIYMGDSATVCVKCGNDMSAQAQSTITSN